MAVRQSSAEDLRESSETLRDRNICKCSNGFQISLATYRKSTFSRTRETANDTIAARLCTMLKATSIRARQAQAFYLNYLLM
jgi:hypothetical protein